VVLAGQGVSKYIEDGIYRYVPYHRLFERFQDISIPQYGGFEGYANRDSLSYRSVYGLDDCPTLIRGTLRKAGYCSAWNVFVQLGMTDDTYPLENSEEMTHRQFLEAFLPPSSSGGDDLKHRLARYLRLDPHSSEIQKLTWLGLFKDTKLGLKKATPAQILQHILEPKWQLKQGDKDMIVMYHHFVYSTVAGEGREVHSSLVVKGDGTDTGTAMAKTVGLPLAIATKLLARDELKTFKGVHIPTHPEIYVPILKELAKDFDISFTTTQNTITTHKQ
jgi:saccharopine dehydrogenase-like NADP-dependent oxidoreductase